MIIHVVRHFLDTLIFLAFGALNSLEELNRPSLRKSAYNDLTKLVVQYPNP